MPTYCYTNELNELCEHPADENVCLWRYMDLSKFVATLAERALFFSRSDLLGDPFEGSTTKATKAKLDGFYQRLKIQHDSQKSSRFIIRNTIISCWHANDHESAAMWKIYLSSSDGIAIRSSFKRLVSSLPQQGDDRDAIPIIAGLVKYADYDNDTIPNDSAFNAFMYKRLSFRHEHELRAVAINLNALRHGSIPDYTAYPGGGENIPVNLERLVESVFVAPTAPGWFLRVVRSIVDRYGYSFPVHQSRLNEDPIY